MNRNQTLVQIFIAVTLLLTGCKDQGSGGSKEGSKEGSKDSESQQLRPEISNLLEKTINEIKYKPEEETSGFALSQVEFSFSCTFSVGVTDCFEFRAEAGLVPFFSIKHVKSSYMGLLSHL